MNITSSQLKKQFQFASNAGWIPFFVEAVETYAKGYFDEADLLAIASRETNLDPTWLKKAGDGGHGFGLMQADVRSFPEWIRSGKWRDAREGILKGADILMQKWIDTNNCIGKKSTVKSSKGGTFSFVGKKVHGIEAQAVTIAAYNSGRWGHYCVSTGRDVDSFTTGKDYSKDVLARAAALRPLIEDWKSRNQKPIIDTTGDTAPTPPETDTDKEFIDKYLKHCKTDSAKNIGVVVAGRIASGATAVWSFGTSGKVFTVLLILAIIAPIIYALYFYRPRIIKGIKNIIDALLSIF